MKPKTLTYAQIELLQYTLKKYMLDSNDQRDDLKSLQNKLIAMRAQSECTKYYYKLTPIEIIRTL